MICVSLAEREYHNYPPILREVELAEIRLDIAGLSASQVEKLFSGPTPLIATCRKGSLPGGKRISLIKTAIQAGADYVDVELEGDSEYRRKVTGEARRRGCRVIVSFHQYGSTPDREKLVSILKACFSAGADIAKLACGSKSFRDNASLLSLYSSLRGREGKIIAIGMGRMGRITRIAAPLLGAPFTYASLKEGSETAPGQLNLQEVRSVLRCIGYE